CAPRRTMTASWSRPTSWCVPPAGPRRLTDAAACTVRLLCRLIVRSAIEHGNADETGIAEDVDQNFHPDRHDKPLWVKSPKGPFSFPAEIWCKLASTVSETEKPHQHPKMPMGSFMLSPLPRLLHLIEQPRYQPFVPRTLRIFNAPGSGSGRVPPELQERRLSYPRELIRGGCNEKDASNSGDDRRCRCGGRSSAGAC